MSDTKTVQENKKRRREFVDDYVNSSRSPTSKGIKVVNLVGGSYMGEADYLESDEGNEPYYANK